MLENKNYFEVGSLGVYEFYSTQDSERLVSTLKNTKGFMFKGYFLSLEKIVQILREKGLSDYEIEYFSNSEDDKAIDIIPYNKTDRYALFLKGF